MHGVQPIAKSRPSSGRRGQPDRRHAVHPDSRCRNGTSPVKTSPSRMVTTPSTSGEVSRYSSSQSPSAPDGGAERDEHGGEAEHEEDGPGEHPAASSAAGSRGRRRTARSRRRRSRAAAASRTGEKNDTSPAIRPRGPRAAWTAQAVLVEPLTHPPTPSRARPTTSSTSSTSVRRRGQLADDAGGDPALGVEHHEGGDESGQRAREVQQRLPVGVEDGRVGHVELRGRTLGPVA